MKIVLSAGSVSRTFVVTRHGNRLKLRDDSGTETELTVVATAGGDITIERDGRRLALAGVALGTERQLWLAGRTLSYVRELAGAAHSTEMDDLTATIPAVVLEILVREGDRVSAGQRLILLESMKMVLPITASKPGIVRAILCREGQSVQPGVALLEIDSDA